MKLDKSQFEVPSAEELQLLDEAELNRLKGIVGERIREIRGNVLLLDLSSMGFGSLSIAVGLFNLATHAEGDVGRLYSLILVQLACIIASSVSRAGGREVKQDIYKESFGWHQINDALEPQTTG